MAGHCELVTGSSTGDVCPAPAQGFVQPLVFRADEAHPSGACHCSAIPHLPWAAGRVGEAPCRVSVLGRCLCCAGCLCWQTCGASRGCKAPILNTSAMMLLPPLLPLLHVTLCTASTECPCVAAQPRQGPTVPHGHGPAPRRERHAGNRCAAGLVCGWCCGGHGAVRDMAEAGHACAHAHASS